MAVSAVPAENTDAIADAFYADAMCSDIGLVLMHLCLFPSVLLTILVDWLEIQNTFFLHSPYRIYLILNICLSILLFLSALYPHIADYFKQL